MILEELEKEIKLKIAQRAKLDCEINGLEKKIKELKSNKFSRVKLDLRNIEYFAYYMSENRGKKDSTIKHYLQTLDKMKEMIQEETGFVFDYSFYEIDDVTVFKSIIEIFENNSNMMAENRARHHDVSAAYNNYYDFLLTKEGEYEKR